MTYITVKIPSELAEEIDKTVEDKKFGYRSRAEFVNDAIRRLISELNVLKKTVVEEVKQVE